MKLRKIMAITIATAMTLASLTACATKTSENVNSNTENVGEVQNKEDTSAKEEKIKIRLLTRMAGTSATVQIYNSIIDEFKAKHPEVEIIDDSQGDESAFNNILSTDVASGKMANIYRVQGVANLKKYIDNGLLLDVKPFLEEDKEWGESFASGALSYYEVPGKDGIYAVPMESGLIGVYYNEDLFKQAGIDAFPQTWEDLMSAISKFREKGITPIALGEQSTYMGGHLHDQIFYKWLGTEAAKELGNRTKKWTDEDVVQTLQFIKDLVDAQAFDPNTVGMTDDIAMTAFKTGEAAMVISGPWMLGRLSNPEDTPIAEHVRIAKFPYFKEKMEFKNHDMQIISPYMINGKLEGKELELTIELVKMLTSREAAKRYAQEARFPMPINGVDLDEEKVGALFVKSMELGATSEGIGVDVFDFDELTSMQDITRNAIMSIFTGSSPMEAAQMIQDEIDNSK